MNKLIMITGGSRGIGRAIAEKFSSHGFDVITAARNLIDLNKVKSEIEHKHGNKVEMFQGDMSVIDDVKKFAQFVVSLNRPIDVLVNNAGFFEPGELCTEPDGTLEKTMNANMYSAYYTTRGIISAMQKVKAGHIFNMCSIASLKAYKNGGSYAISKFALLGFSKCLREEMKSFNIKVTAIMPGATRTDSWAASDLPESRFMKVEDVAESVYSAYSLSERSVVEEIVIRPMLGDI